MTGALLVAGTSSDAGKSVLVAGLCRWLRRRGIAVAPFKAQNMSNNSFATADGGEIGRAQAMQAAAAGIEPEILMNPVLLKPGSDAHSQVVLLGRPVAEVDALSYRELKPQLLDTVLACLAELRSRFDVVICEGAGSPAEINLRADDIANLGLARAADLPTIVVGDIDRGGVLAAMFGTLAVLDPADQAMIAGFVVNKFRGDRRLLDPGLTTLQELTGRQVYGVLPWRADLWLDVEDSLALDARGGPDRWAADCLRVAVIRFPRISNLTDADALAAEPGVQVRFVNSPADLLDAHLVVLPGTRATVADLGWLRDRGLAAAVVERARAGRPVLGVCGGYQMMARQIRDDVESRVGAVTGLGLLPCNVEFGPHKIVGRTRGTEYDVEVVGYEMHHGVIRPEPGATAFLDGVRAGAVWGTTWHGVMESDGFRRAFLAEVATAAGVSFTPGTVSFAEVRERRFDALGDLVADHLDTAGLDGLIAGGVPAGLPPLRVVRGSGVGSGSLNT
ncbi:MAG TPA: cobyric acid synthase [Sporichthyaceae bacterium]|nr:cobyric acid synthase [Sporichthyaceae bacterium]